MTSIFKGSTEACLAHFARQAPEELKIPLLAEFTQAGHTTVGRWLVGGQMPGGEFLLRLRVLLDLVGYSVNELAVLKASARVLASVIAYGLASTEDICLELGYKQNNQVQNLVLRAHEPQAEKAQRIDALAKEHLAAVNRSHDLWIEKLADLTAALGGTPVLPSTVSQLADRRPKRITNTGPRSLMVAGSNQVAVRPEHRTRVRPRRSEPATALSSVVETVLLPQPAAVSQHTLVQALAASLLGVSFQMSALEAQLEDPAETQTVLEIVDKQRVKALIERLDRLIS